MSKTYLRRCSRDYDNYGDDDDDDDGGCGFHDDDADDDADDDDLDNERRLWLSLCVKDLSWEVPS